MLQWWPFNDLNKTKTKTMFISKAFLFCYTLLIDQVQSDSLNIYKTPESTARNKWVPTESSDFSPPAKCCFSKCFTTTCASAGLLPNKELRSRGSLTKTWVNATGLFFSSNMHIFNKTFPQRRRKPSLHSDEEDDVVGHHDLVVVLHAAQGAADLGLGEAALAALVDVVHQGRHLHWLSVSRLEDGKQRRLELFQPGGSSGGRVSDTHIIWDATLYSTRQSTAQPIIYVYH